MFKGSEYWGSGPQEPWRGADSIRFSLHPRSRSHSVSSIAGTRRQLSLRLHSLTLNELYQAFPYNWVRQPCDLLPANFFFWKDVHFMDHFEDSPWICKVVWEIWIISHLFFEISCFVVFFAVSHCRLFLKRFSLAISILLLLVWGEPREKSLDPRDPNLLQRLGERELGGKYRCLNYRYFSKGQRERQETETQKCFLLTWTIMSSWGWK